MLLLESLLVLITQDIYIQHVLKNVATALSRGGDQFLVSDVNEKDPTIIDTEKIGAQNDYRLQLKRFASKLIYQIQQSNYVFICGHTHPDYDAIAAALGLSFLCDLLGVKSSIIIDYKKIDDIVKKTNFSYH